MQTKTETKVNDFIKKCTNKTIDKDCFVDLHMHTTNSDGFYSTSEILNMCSQQNLKIISITDHDSVGAYYDIINQNIEFDGQIICGTELTFACDNRTFDCLAYGFDIDKMHKWLTEYYSVDAGIENQKLILRDMIDLYTKLGIKFDKNQIVTQGRKSEAYNLIKTSVLQHEENKVNFPEFWQNAFYKRYHTNPNSKFYINETRNMPTLKEITKIAHDCGGICSLAHSGAYEFSTSQIKEYINYAISCNVDALEFKYTLHTPEIQKIIYEIAQKHNLLLSGGSDFHGEQKRPNFNLGFVFNGEHIKARDILPFIELALKLTRLNNKFF